MHAVSGCWRSLRRGCKRQTSRIERQLPAPLAGAACQEPTDVAMISSLIGGDVPQRKRGHTEPPFAAHALLDGFDEKLTPCQAA
jgi:hypothetical protein